jgi:hypothetical protein
MKRKVANVCLAGAAALLFFGCFGSPNFPGTFAVAAAFAAVPILFGTARIRVAGLALLAGALACIFLL